MSVKVKELEGALSDTHHERTALSTKEKVTSNNTSRIMSKRRRTTRKHRDVSLNHLFKTKVPKLSKGNEDLQSTSHVYDTGHEQAAPLTAEIELTEQETYLLEGVGEEASFLLQELIYQGLESFSYQNETKVQNLVGLCLKDALRSQGLF